VENSPIRCAVGSNALHIAALTGNIIMAKLILEQQESVPGLDLRSRTNAAGLKPHDYAASGRNPVLQHLLDERLPVTLLRQVWAAIAGTCHTLHEACMWSRARASGVPGPSADRCCVLPFGRSG
jgi:hypothetical protein